MGEKILQEVWQHAPVRSAEMLVLLALAHKADDETRLIRIGYLELLTMTRLNSPSVDTALEALSYRGIISKGRITRAKSWAGIEE